MKKILFGITSLTIGGAERVLVDLANELCNDHNITIFTIYPNGEFEKSLSNKIKLKSLYNKRYNELSKIQKVFVPLKVWINKNQIYNKYIKENFDVEIAFLEGPITRLISVRNSGTKKVAWIHNDISRVFGNNLKSKIKRHIDEKIYNKFDELVFVSKDNKKSFEKIYKNNAVKKEIIYNYINSENILKKSNDEIPEIFAEDELNFVTVARLVEQKGIDRLIRVHSKLIKENLKHKIWVIGDGPEYKKLESLVDSNNVKDTFKLLGKRENPYPYIKKADYFCLLSYFEGYGMVLEEAKILGKDILITNTAAREAVEGYEYATIIENNENDIYKVLKEKILKGKDTINKSEKTKDYNNEDIIQKIKNILDSKKGMR